MWSVRSSTAWTKSFAEDVVPMPAPPAMPRGYCDPHFVAVTSLAPRVCPRQTSALDSWVKFGLTIHAVNTASEIASLKAMYPQVDHWHSSEAKTTVFSKRTATSDSLLGVAVETGKAVLLVNADCETYGDPNVLIELMGARRLVMGIRYNYLGDYRVAPSREAWGIDSFVITPEMVLELPRLGFGIGCPVWDYWIPLHFQLAKYSIVATSEPWLYHRTHHLAWEQSDWLVGAAISRGSPGCRDCSSICCHTRYASSSFSWSGMNFPVELTTNHLPRLAR